MYKVELSTTTALNQKRWRNLVNYGMLYVRNLTLPEQHALKQLRNGPPNLARRARILLLSAAGVSVPAIAEAFNCCRRAIRAWIHAFQRDGLLGLAGKALGRPAKPRDHNSAMSFPLPEQVPAARRQVPVIPVTVPEMRRLLNEIVWHPQHSAAFVLYWSTYRRYKQALAKCSHYRKRDAEPPEFEQVRL